MASRIWYLGRNRSHVLDCEGSEHKLTPIARIILESGLLNAAFLFAFVMTVVFGSSSLEIMSEMVSITVSGHIPASEPLHHDSVDVLFLIQGTPMCGIVFSIVIFRVGLRRRNHFQRDTSGEPTMGWAAAIMSFGTQRSCTNPNSTVAHPHALRQSVVQDSPTELRVFVHHTSSRGYDDVGSTWKESMPVGKQPRVDVHDRSSIKDMAV